MAAKRRKVWVNFYEDGSNDGCAFETKTDAAESASTAYRMRQVKFIEARPGDVVLSRETHSAIRDELSTLEDAIEMGLIPEAQALLQKALALLRGGR